MSPSTVSNLNKKIYAKIEAWRNRRIEGEHPYLYLDLVINLKTAKALGLTVPDSILVGADKLIQ